MATKVLGEDGQTDKPAVIKEPETVIQVADQNKKKSYKEALLAIAPSVYPTAHLI